MARIYRSLTEAGDTGPSAVTIGNFDGVHIGHRRIFERVAAVARQHGWRPTVLTFDPHPAKVVAPARAPRMIGPLEERCRLIASAGIEQIFILPFDRTFSELSPREFVEQVLVEKLQAKAVLVGDNFRFGNRQAGDVGTLAELGRKYGFQTEVIPGVQFRGSMVSSSEVRRSLDAGEVTRAWRFLGRPFAIEGRVVPGHGIGRKQTVPTLNLESAAEILPANGVYVTRTYALEDDRHWPSVTNVGVRPTFGGDKLSVETFLLDSLEGETPPSIRVEFLHRVREERKFESPEQLKAQIMRDVGVAQKWFSRCAAFKHQGRASR